MPASNPYNPYYATGTLMPTMIGPEHAATALAGQNMQPQAVPLGASATNNAAHTQKRNDRIQVKILDHIIDIYFLIYLL